MVDKLDWDGLAMAAEVVGKGGWLASVLSIDLDDHESRLPSDVQRALALSALQARSVLEGDRLWLLRFLHAGELIGWGMATLRRGKLRAGLTVTMAGDSVPSDGAFWGLLEQIGAHFGATVIQFERVGSDPTERIPGFRGEVSRYVGEALYVVDLESVLGAPEAQFSKNTKRNIARASKSGISLRVTRDAEALEHHLSLTGLSMDRRQQRGEDVTLRASATRVRDMISRGQGVLYQAVLGDEALSSDFVFRLGSNAYYYDGGSSPRGMKEGSSHFLMAALLNDLRGGGVKYVNLGIARAGNDGLARFKAGFAADLWFVERVVVDCRSATRLGKNLLLWLTRQRSQ